MTALPTPGPPPAAPAPAVRPVPRWPGWLCLAPVVLLLIGQTIVPSVRTVAMSFLDSNLFADEPGEWVGLANYLAGAELIIAFAVAGVPAIALFVGALIIALPVGLLGGRITGPLGSAIRIGIGLLLVCYAPVAMVFGRFGRDAEPPDPVPLMISSYLPLVAAVSAAVALAVFAAGGRRSWPAAAGLAAFGLLGSAAWALQTVDFSLIYPSRGRELPGYLGWRWGFQLGDPGQAAAVHTLELIALAVCGVLATVILLLVRIRFEVSGPGQGRPAVAGGVGALLIVVAGLLATVLVHRTWVGGLFSLPGGATEEIGARAIGTAIVNTWLPSGLGTLVQVVVALLAGAAIGLFRPIGPNSRWLLLIFAPAMFTSVAPLAMIYYLDLRQLGLIDLWIGLVPRLWVVGPAIVVFSLVFEAVRRHREQSGSYRAALPVLAGVVALTTVVLWLVQAQALLWSTMVAVQPELRTAPMLMVTATQYRYTAEGVLWLPLPLPIMIIAAAAVAGSLLLSRRLRIGAGPG